MMLSKLANSLLTRDNKLAGSFKVKINKNNFEFTGPANLEPDFKFMESTYEFNPKKKRMEFVNSEYTMALSSYFGFSSTYVKLGLGFLIYIYAQYTELLSEESKQSIKDACLFDLETNFYDLYESQRKDLKLLMHYKRGIFQCYTGYGKTQVISVLMDYIVNVLKEPIVVLVPDTKPKNELMDRYIELTGGTLPDYYDSNSIINVISVKGFLRSNSFNEKDEYFKRVKWVLADEVEYCINNSGIKLFNLFSNADKWYGFSATPDKKSGNRIWIDRTKSPVITRNFDLVNYFSFSTVFRKPDKHSIKLTSIVTECFENLSIPNSNLMYTEVLKRIFIYPKVCDLIKSIAKKESPLFIPFQLLEVIDNWIKNYFNDMTVINICGRGYEYFENGVLKDKLDLMQVKDLIENNKVNVITGTSSVYRALDFKGITNILPLTSKLAGIVIQSIGRIARDTNFRILCIEPTEKVPIYSGDLAKRKKLIKDYYSDCKITKDSRTDLDYGILI